MTPAHLSRARGLRATWFAAVLRCVAVAALACVLTRSVFHHRSLDNVDVSQPMLPAATLSVTDDISRRLAAVPSSPRGARDDGPLWAGAE